MFSNQDFNSIHQTPMLRPNSAYQELFHFYCLRSDFSDYFKKLKLLLWFKLKKKKKNFFVRKKKRFLIMKKSFFFLILLQKKFFFFFKKLNFLSGKIYINLKQKILRSYLFFIYYFRPRIIRQLFLIKRKRQKKILNFFFKFKFKKKKNH